jgi:hypothetical protein
MFTSILHGLLTGFLFPIQPWLYLRELPLPNFFDDEVSDVATVHGVIFGTRMQVSCGRVRLMVDGDFVGDDSECRVWGIKVLKLVHVFSPLARPGVSVVPHHSP